MSNNKSFDMEQLREKLREAELGLTRYETVRKLNATQFAEIYRKNIETGVPFDQLVDELSGATALLPVAFDGCDCDCHHIPGVMHCMPCCHPSKPLPLVYVASRASLPERPAMWKRIRASGAAIVSSWIDEAEAGATDDFSRLWMRIVSEIKSSDRLVLYVEPEDLPLKGAYIEVGMALAMGKQVLVIAPGITLNQRDHKPLGSWAKHPNVTFCDDVNIAVGLGAENHE